MTGGSSIPGGPLTDAEAATARALGMPATIDEGIHWLLDRGLVDPGPKPGTVRLNRHGVMAATLLLTVVGAQARAMPGALWAKLDVACRRAVTALMRAFIDAPDAAAPDAAANAPDDQEEASP